MTSAALFAVFQLTPAKGEPFPQDALESAPAVDLQVLQVLDASFVRPFFYRFSDLTLIHSQRRNPQLLGHGNRVSGLFFFTSTGAAGTRPKARVCLEGEAEGHWLCGFSGSETGRGERLGESLCSCFQHQSAGRRASGRIERGDLASALQRAAETVHFESGRSQASFTSSLRRNVPLLRLRFRRGCLFEKDASRRSGPRGAASCCVSCAAAPDFPGDGLAPSFSAAAEKTAKAFPLRFAGTSRHRNSKPVESCREGPC